MSQDQICAHERMLDVHDYCPDCGELRTSWLLEGAKLRARIAELEAQCESAHAAQRHAETELAQYMAWYAMAEHQHLHEKARAERAEAERDGLRVRITALEDEKNAYIDYVGDALGQDHDGESLWDAAQRVLSDRDRVKALAVRWLRKWQTDMNPTPEMLEQTHALIGAALGERTEGGQ